MVAAVSAPPAQGEDRRGREPRAADPRAEPCIAVLPLTSSVTLSSSCFTLSWLSLEDVHLSPLLAALGAGWDHWPGGDGQFPSECI